MDICTYSGWMKDDHSDMERSVNLELISNGEIDYSQYFCFEQEKQQTDEDLLPELDDLVFESNDQFMMICFQEKDARYTKMKLLLESCSVVKSEYLCDVDIYEHPDYEGFISSYNKGAVRYPVLIVDDLYIGDLEQIEEIVNKGIMEYDIQKLLTERGRVNEETVTNYLLSNESAPSLNIVSSLLDSFERTKSRWTSESPSLPIPRQMVSFSVIHTNWYFRQLHRTFYFGEKVFFRVNPIKTTIRAIIRYDEISHVTLLSQESIEIYYRSNKHPDHITTTTRDITSIISLLKKRVFELTHRELIVQ
eukprot:TRINITY_DN1168_c0_g1_i7.p1 TRINITY_DN1168_c0_g1~~TRINITY_DN1168_c0_g1_i7.p1  ORF type:complete len:306 (-),score=63.95 TRINITY_DN1168_c0_g1_i7:133-1050(-)